MAIYNEITGAKITPNQLAKVAMIDAIDSMAALHREGDEEFWGTVTEREHQEFMVQLRKRIEGLERYLGAVDKDGVYADWHNWAGRRR